MPARANSTHGYDIIDHNSINPDLGGAAGFERLCAALRTHGMGQILDMVPNHMGVMGADNAWWMDVIENGPASAFGEFFDIDWHPANPELLHRVLVPVLGDHYGAVLEAGELKLVFEADLGSFSVFYYGNRLPDEPLDAVALDAYRERIERYMLKAVREAKVQTSWINVNAEYEEALAGFVRALLARLEANPFLDDIRLQARPVAWFGMLNSLSMTLVKLTSPGVPDFYQGSEIFDLSLVDPDNRRPVDYARRRTLLRELEEIGAVPADAMASSVRAFFAVPHDGRAKLWLAWRALQFRRRYEELFLKGNYRPVAVAGSRARHVVAYARGAGEVGIVVAAGRLFASMGLEPGVLPVGEAARGDTALDLAFLPAGTCLVNVLTGESIRADASGRLLLSRAMTHFPGALLAYGAPAI